MSDLSRDGTSTYRTTGTPDTATVESDGQTGTTAHAANLNGLYKAVTDLQNMLGNGVTLLGSVQDLATRLGKTLAANGSIAQGLAFPLNPTDGQIFYRPDLNQPFWYDIATGTWFNAIGVAAGATLSHSTLSNLSADDHVQYVLGNGTRAMTGDLNILKSAPALRLTGSEGSALDVEMRENAGVLSFFKNIGTYVTPVWTGMSQKIAPALGPISTGAGSAIAHEGDVTIAGATSLSGVHYYHNFTVNAGAVVSVPVGSRRLILICSGVCTIKGTVSGLGGGVAGVAGDSVNGFDGSSSSGGGGASGGVSTGGVGGNALFHGVTIKAGGLTNGGAGASITALDVALEFLSGIFMGGASGGSGGDDGGVGGDAGGAGGADIVIIAPTVILANTSVISSQGAVGIHVGGYSAGGGGGGLILIATGSYTDNGCTFNMSGGPGNSGIGVSGAGGAGQKQILIYSNPLELQ